jgi:hypothetical protein
MKIPAGPVARYPLAVPPGAHRCSWPMWRDDERPNFRYCDDPRVVAGRSYCVEHMCGGYTNWEAARARWEAAHPELVAAAVPALAA